MSIEGDKVRLRRALTKVRLAPEYEAAVEAGVERAVMLWPGEFPEKQLEEAKRVALEHLATRIGWK